MASNTEKILIYVDTETTGTDPFGLKGEPDKITELAYAVGSGEVKTLYFGVTEVNDFIDDLTKFYARGIDKLPASSVQEFTDFLDASKGNTMVAANPGFDAGFLEAAGLYNFSYRKLDIESYAMHALSLDYVPGMADIHRILKEDYRYDIAAPNHTAAGDVISLRQMHYILKTEFPAEKRR